MITIDIDAKYNARPARFYGDISSTFAGAVAGLKYIKPKESEVK